MIEGVMSAGQAVGLMGLALATGCGIGLLIGLCIDGGRSGR